VSVCFADSCYYLALLNRRDECHEKAEALAGSIEGRSVTTGWVLTEVADALSHRAHRRHVVELVEALRADPDCEIVPPSAELLGRGWRLYVRRPDKDWSLTDCVSFVVMRDEGITEALTADHHFEQAGFTILLGR
jgi:predicted nucleic acid-binding protein